MTSRTQCKITGIPANRSVANICCLFTAGALALMLASCAAPIGADRVTTRQASEQVNANALSTGTLSAKTVAILHAYDLDSVVRRNPEEAVRQLHEKAVVTGERDLLFALAELSYQTGDRIRSDVKPWDSRDARDYYLGSAMYAWLFLFGEGRDAPPSAYDRRFRQACDFYNFGLGLALTERRGTNGVVRLEEGLRKLPVGEITLRLKDSPLAAQAKEFERILLADQLRVRGLSARNRDAGLGAPLICVSEVNTEFKLRPSSPATAFLRLPLSLAAIGTSNATGSLELYSPFEDSATVNVAGTAVPLESDLTTYRAYVLNQSRIWELGRLQFLAPGQHIRSQLILNQPYEPGRVPVVFVHGTFSSPVTWAEMANSLIADPELRKHYQIWSFIYSSGNPLPLSIAELRDALTATVQRLDPEGKDPALRQMVIIGHSQGGLLTKCTAIESGDRLWRIYSTKPLDQLNVSESDREKLRHLFFFEPLPVVKRVVFIATPHRGSYLSGSFVRNLARRLVSLPQAVLSKPKQLIALTKGSQAEKFLNGKMTTSLDGMSPKNPGLLAIAEIPVLPPIKAHSIIAVEEKGDFHLGRDGLVSYESAHQDYAESEFIVRSYHTCLDEPATVGEVRRILHEHLDSLK